MATNVPMTTNQQQIMTGSTYPNTPETAYGKAGKNPSLLGDATSGPSPEEYAGETFDGPTPGMQTLHDQAGDFMDGIPHHQTTADAKDGFQHHEQAQYDASAYMK